MAEGDSHCILIGLETGLTSPGSRLVCRAAAKFEFKLPGVHSVVRGHPAHKSECSQAEICQVWCLLLLFSGGRLNISCVVKGDVSYGAPHRNGSLCCCALYAEWNTSFCKYC